MPPSDHDIRNRLGHEWAVSVCDPQPSRLKRVSAIVADLGLRPREFYCFSDLVALNTSSPHRIAVVALDSGSSHKNDGLDAIQALKQKGFKIICYEEDIQSLPLAIRCQAFLFGALRVLDHKNSGFARDLQGVLTHLARLEIEELNEKDRLKNRMRAIGMIGESEAMLSVFRWTLKASTLSDFPALITGETGTGKDLVARAIHRFDPKRRDGPFIAVNCGAISSGVAESELFGHRRGSFTGADRNRKGLFRAAQGGVLFLDEIGEMDEVLQAKLLRVIQENRVLGVGEDHDVPINVRIVAATNRDLEQMSKEGKFRADLFHRLYVLSTSLRPLRERPEDLAPLIEFFVKKHSHLMTTKALAVDRDYLAALARVPLQGNVRELENIVRLAVLEKTDDTPLGLRDLPPRILEQLSMTSTQEQERACDAREMSAPIPRSIEAHQLEGLLEANGWSLSRALGYCEKAFLTSALRRSRGNHSKTAQLLGLTPRSIYNKMRKHNLCF